MVSSRHSWNTAQIFHTVVKLVHLSRYINVMSGLMDLYHKFVYSRVQRVQQLTCRFSICLCHWLVSLTQADLFALNPGFLHLKSVSFNGHMGRRAEVQFKCSYKVMDFLWKQK